MRCVVLNVDQRKSRKSADAVAEALEVVNDSSSPWSLAAAAERTIGDEWQVALSDPESVTSLLVWVIESSLWHVGLGIGAVETPLPASTREARGDAYVAAREAANVSKRSPYSVAVRSSDAHTALSQTLLWALAGVVNGRSAEGAQACTLRSSGMSGVGIARYLGISPQAVSTRLKVADWVVGEALKAQLTEAIGACLKCQSA